MAVRTQCQASPRKLIRKMALREHLFTLAAKARIAGYFQSSVRKGVAGRPAPL